MSNLEKTIAKAFLEMAEGLETGSFGPRPKIAITGMGSEHGEENAMKAARMAAVTCPCLCNPLPPFGGKCTTAGGRSAIARFPKNTRAPAEKPSAGAFLPRGSGRGPTARHASLATAT